MDHIGVDTTPVATTYGIPAPRVHADEWAESCGQSSPGPRLTRAEQSEALDLLDDLGGIVGWVPTEAVAALRHLIRHPDGADRFILGYLRQVMGGRVTES